MEKAPNERGLLYTVATKYAKQTFITVPNRNTLQTVSTNAQIVFVWLCSMQNNSGHAFPSFDRLAELTHTSRSSVKRALVELEDVGMITKAFRADNNGKQMSNLYEVMVLDTEPALEPEEQNQGVHTDPPKKVTGGSHRPPRKLQPKTEVEGVHTDPVGGSHRTGEGVTVNRGGGHSEPRTKTNITKPNLTKSNTLAKKSPDDEIAVLYYQVIQALDLPVRNHVNVKSKIQELSRNKNRAEVVQYLKFMRDKFVGIHWDYKPHINEALDIHAKRTQIINSLKKYREDQQHSQAARI